MRLYLVTVYYAPHNNGVGMINTPPHVSCHVEWGVNKLHAIEKALALEGRGEIDRITVKRVK